MTDVELNPPTKRECLRCGRRDVWDAGLVCWRIVEEDGRKLSGNPFCMHEWDITGTHKPIRELA